MSIILDEIWVRVSCFQFLACFGQTWKIQLNLDSIHMESIPNKSDSTAWAKNEALNLNWSEAPGTNSNWQCTTHISHITIESCSRIAARKACVCLSFKASFNPRYPRSKKHELLMRKSSKQNPVRFCQHPNEWIHLLCLRHGDKGTVSQGTTSGSVPKTSKSWATSRLTYGLNMIIYGLRWSNIDNIV